MNILSFSFIFIWYLVIINDGKKGENDEKETYLITHRCHYCSPSGIWIVQNFHQLAVEYQTGELSFTITPEKDHIKEGETFKILLNLTNRGDKKIRVWPLEEHVSYNVFFYDSRGRSVLYVCGMPIRVQLTDKHLIELLPGESITAARDSSCWNLTKGEYTVGASYHTGPAEAERITKPYWFGTIKSNNLTIFVL